MTHLQYTYVIIFFATDKFHLYIHIISTLKYITENKYYLSAVFPANAGRNQLCLLLLGGNADVVPTYNALVKRSD